MGKPVLRFKGYQYTKLALFCKNCGSRAVRWDKYFDMKGIQRWTLTDTGSERPHRETCSAKPQTYKPGPKKQ